MFETERGRLKTVFRRPLDLRAGLFAQIKCFVQHSGCQFHIFFVNQYRNFDFRSGNHLDIDAFFRQRAEDFGGHSGVRAHTHADGGYFAYGVVAVDGGGADAGFQAVQQVERLFVVAARYSELKIGGPFLADVLDNHVDFDVGIGHRA